MNGKGHVPNTMRVANSSKQTVLAFIDRINAHDAEGLGELMSDDHVFIDAHGNQVSGRDKMIPGWRGYFGWFPDYHVEVTEIFEEGDKLALFGFAGGSFQGKQTENWRLPAAWKAELKDGRVTLASLCRYEDSVRDHRAKLSLKKRGP